MSSNRMESEDSTAYSTDGCTTRVVYGGGVIEEFESSGCVYSDLGMRQGCPECRLE